MSFASDFRTVLVLGRVSNLPTIWTNVAVGWFLSGGSWNAEFAWILFGMSLLYIAGMTLNDAFDASWDRENSPDRPIASGKITEKFVWILGVIQMLAGIAILFLLSTVHPLFLGLLVLFILLYNWLHKKWAGSVLIMGLCRAMVYLGAASAVVAQTSQISVSPAAVLVSIGVMLYIAGITLAARSEHLESPAGPGFLPRILLTLPVLFPLLGSRTQPHSLTATGLVVAGVLGIWAWIVITRAAFRKKLPLGIAYSIAGIALFDAAVVAFADWRAAVFAMGCFLITLLGQKRIPAT